MRKYSSNSTLDQKRRIELRSRIVERQLIAVPMNMPERVLPKLRVFACVRKIPYMSSNSQLA
jgi:hypothetical protein